MIGKESPTNSDRRKHFLRTFRFHGRLITVQYSGTHRVECVKISNLKVMNSSFSFHSNLPC
jgi:hypothetical protein